jgi:hypothetical protein
VSTAVLRVGIVANMSLAMELVGVPSVDVCLWTIVGVATVVLGTTSIVVGLIAVHVRAWYFACRYWELPVRHTWFASLFGTHSSLRAACFIVRLSLGAVATGALYVCGLPNWHVIFGRSIVQLAFLRGARFSGIATSVRVVVFS